MAISVVPYDPAWAAAFERVAQRLRPAVAGIPGARVEHVGSTSVPGLAAKPIIDVDVIVPAAHLPAVVAALASLGYVHRGDLGVTGREAFHPPDVDPPRHVYACAADTLHVRNHLAVRAVLRARPDLRDRYGAVKLALAADPSMDIDRYLAGKTALLQEVLACSDLDADDLATIRRLNDPDA